MDTRYDVLCTMDDPYADHTLRAVVKQALLCQPA